MSSPRRSSNAGTPPRRKTNDADTGSPSRGKENFKNPRKRASTLDTPRKRASTLEIELPRAENNPQSYTVERAQKGIDYAKQRRASTKRKPSPNEVSFLAVYQAACESLQFILEVEPADKKAIEERAYHVRTIEKDLGDRGWLKVCESDNAQRWQEQLLGLRRLAMYARYSDYAKMEVHKLRLVASKERDEKAFNELNRKSLWSDVSDRIVKETAAWNNMRYTGGVTDEAPTTLAVWNTCLHVHMDFERTIEIIHFYGERNKLVHSNVEEVFRKRHWFSLAKILFTDYSDVNSVIPAHHTAERAFMEAFLYEKISRWFTWEKDFDNYQSWEVTKQLKEDRDEMDKKQEPRKVIDKIDELAAEVASRSAEEQELHRLAMHQVETAARDFPTRGPVLKRTRSQGSFENQQGAYRLLKSRRQGVVTAVEKQKQSMEEMDEATKALGIHKAAFDSAKAIFDSRKASVAMSVTRVIDAKSQLNQCILDFGEKYEDITEHPKLAQ